MEQKDNSILIIGPNSLVGSRTAEILHQDGFNVYGASRSGQGQNFLASCEAVDVTDFDAVSNLIEQIPAKIIVNFAADTNVDGAEANKVDDKDDFKKLSANPTYAVNTIGAQNIAGAADRFGKKLVHISTDFVFDGEKGPYKEDILIGSMENLGWYGYTKARAEQFVQSHSPSAIILRISYPYRRFCEKGDFARGFINLYDQIQRGERDGFYPIFTDQKLTPTFIDDIAEAIEVLTAKNLGGIFHVASPQVTTPYDFACEVLRVARGVENPEQMIPRGSILDFQRAKPEAARRPINGGLLVNKIVEAGFKPLDWKTGIIEAFGYNE